MSIRYPHIIPEIEDWPINLLSRSRDEFIQELVNEVVAILKSDPKNSLADLINRTVYLEKIRVRTNKWKVDPGNELQYWQKIAAELSKLNTSGSESNEHDQEIEELAKRVVHRYAEEIVGDFRPKTFKFARRFLTFFFKRLLNTAANRNHKRLWGNKYQLHERLKVDGPIEDIRALMKKGTVVILPTHFSNLDSILIGYALDAVVGLPAFSYGAGLNLFDAEILAYFMTRLGAYRVDRRKKNPIYLQTLKAMSRLSIEKGVNSIFFPGGTRSREGKIETRTKLGLLGSLVEAQRNLVQRNESNKIIIVPLVLSYHFVLEAKFLIEQQLKRKGEDRYSKTRDHFKSYTKISKFIWKLFSESSEITLSFGEPMDVFGNRLDKNANSLDEKQKIINIEDYFVNYNGETYVGQRDNVYTKKLSTKIIDSYHRNNVVLSSHLVAFVAFRILLENNKNRDLFGILNLPSDDFSIPFETFKDLVEKYQKILFEMERNKKVKLAESIHLDSESLIKEGIKHVGLYHPLKPLTLSKDESAIGSQDFSVLYYYHNRLENYELDQKLKYNFKNTTV